ncbi:aldehyde dehydrogenase [Renibacterium salmoninarum ATCC 33209]|uniref:Aldehyde dehydrogenase n=1 Tax=Renibacterium salmoninarum (strain ATCC 33209 / DSM 20767 / JCM 11484 / NBRC 15589 / NCIMB 2235) TaxID=288705 RepID=A9WTA6_RENSM|nr:aldehyde dehydrogenase [Renibacterium salmoninarum ATCC 33209]
MAGKPHPASACFRRRPVELRPSCHRRRGRGRNPSQRCQGAVVSFTGSAAVGHQIARSAAPRKAVLELDSNAAMIIAADADLPAAVDAVLRGGFYASGQACISVQRVIVEAAIADEFETALVAAMPQVIYGDPRAETTRIAPLIDAQATSRVHDWLAAASNAGARTIYSGAANASAAKAQLPPTVLADVPSSALAWREEIFGPVVCLRSVPNFEAAITLANDSRYGLQAAVFTSSLKQAMTAIDQLQVGGVVVNDVPGFRSDIMPYGGIKDSGIGREGPRFAIEELTVTKMAIIRP